jgi:hypothetical protein
MSQKLRYPGLASICAWTYNDASDEARPTSAKVRSRRRTVVVMNGPHRGTATHSPRSTHSSWRPSTAATDPTGWRAPGLLHPVPNPDEGHQRLRRIALREHLGESVRIDRLAVDQD